MADNEGMALALEDYGHWKNHLFNAARRSSEGTDIVLEALRLGHVEGKVGYRESQSMRTVTESGSGHARGNVPQGGGG